MGHYVDTFGDVYSNTDDSCTIGIDNILHRQQLLQFLEASNCALNNIESQIKKEKEIKKMKTPEIIDVKMKVKNKVVEVAFADFTKEKAVCIEPDVFDMERAIATCVAKKAMGGSGAYNKAVRKGLKVWEKRLKKQEFDKAEKERIEKKRAKLKAYKQRRRERKEAEEKERQIEIQKEAYIRAMKELEK